MKSLRIAMVAACPFPANRGTPSRILRMSEALAALGHEIHVVTYHFGIDIPTNHIHIHRLPDFPYRRLDPGPSLTKLCLLDPLLAWRLYRIVQSLEIDIIHAHHFEGALAGLFARVRTGVPMIYDAHTTLAGELHHYRFLQFKKLVQFLDKQIPAWSQHTVAVSESLRAFLESQNIPGEKIDVVPTGVHLETFQHADGQRIRAKHHLGDRPIIMYTGSLAAFQGIDHLAPVIEAIVAQIPEAILLVVGDWSHNSPGKQLPHRRDLSPNVLFVDNTPFSEIPDYLGAADVVVSPRIECPGIPQKLVNYMAAGKAIVSFEGSAKLLRHRYNGVIIENGRIKPMAEAIVALLQNPDQRTRLGRNARASIRGRYDWPTLSRGLEQLYFRLLDRHLAS